MKSVTVGMGDMQISEDPESLLVTYALGSCIGVLVHDPIRKVGGLIHYMLPQSEVSPEKAAARPAMFADKGVPLLFRTLYERQCRKQDLIVKVCGGAKLYDDNGTFEIGRRNYMMLRKLFWKAGVAITSEDVGGSTPRTARLWVGTGRATVTKGTEEVEL